jgi:hypothetical protein
MVHGEGGAQATPPQSQADQSATAAGDWLHRVASLTPGAVPPILVYREPMGRIRRWMGVSPGVWLTVLASLVLVPSARANVLRVGTYHGIPGPFNSIQAAVDAAKPGDWILIGPGDYKTSTGRMVPGRSDEAAGVLITKPRLRIRGMNRNSVIVDGTKPGSSRCSPAQSAQNFGPNRKRAHLGLNGILVWKADSVWVQNLTACNFLGGNGTAGNEIWWNGGDGSGKIGGWGYLGSYLTATSRFFHGEKTAAEYGIFSSNWQGGSWDQTYSSNFNDSGYYIGACHDQCFQTMNHAWAQYSALGYSGTNSGGPLLIENSEFSQNEEGADTNSENNSDWPSPQTGQCPAGATPRIPGAHSCWIFYKNYVHDNNNANVPSNGPAAAAPVGTGMTLSGGRNDTVMNNVFKNNDAWGIAFVPYPDTGTPPSNATPCVGGISNFSALGLTANCFYDDWNNALIDNTFSHNGSYGNTTNGDFAEITFTPGHPINCFSGNTNTGGTLTSSPSDLQQTNPACGPTASTPDQNIPFVLQLFCDTQIFGDASPCLPGSNYPRRTHVVMHALPSNLKTMPNPCAGVPANPWCRAKSAATKPIRFTG